MQRAWVREGLAFVVLGERISTSLGIVLEATAACLVIVYGEWAYYASGPSGARDVMPALLWRAVRACKAMDVRWFEVGWIGQATDPKGKAIEFFRSRFSDQRKPANWLAMQEVVCQS